jgi:hypothetical protein
MRSPRKTTGKPPTTCEQDRWTKAGLPRQGWVRVAADEADSGGGTCDHCRKVFTGPAHVLRHHNYDGALRVDRQCSRELRVKPLPTLPKASPRSREEKRHQWLARAWRRGSGFDGPLSLPADGYVTTVWSQKNGWRFEIRPIGQAKICRAATGYACDKAARLAAFDAITELLQEASARSKPPCVQPLVDGWGFHSRTTDWPHD